MVEKLRTFIIYDDQIGAAMVMGDIETALQYIRSMLEEMENDSGVELEIQRQDMTKEEIEALPEEG